LTSESPQPDAARIRTIGVVANPAKHQSREVVERIAECGGNMGLRVLVVPEAEAPDTSAALDRVDEADLAESCDAVIACGGDGTILRAARLLSHAPRPILGVNLGRLGFLAELPPEDLEDGIAHVASGRYTIEKRMTLEASVDGLDDPLFALNDVVVTKSNQARIIVLEMSEAGKWVNTYGGDGLVLATPTGSTAYALSADGPIVSPDVDAVVAAPICPHSLTVRPMVFPGTVKLNVAVVHAGDSEALVTADGQTVHALEPGQNVSLRRGERGSLLMHLDHSSYYDILRQKLNWGMDKAQQQSARP